MGNYRLSIRKLEREDIPFIISWAKNKTVTKHFHVPLPSTEQAGNQWFQRSLIDRTKDDFLIHIIDEDGNKKPIGILGIFNIDESNKKCEYYICIGDHDFIHRGIAYRTSAEMLGNYFKTFNYNKIIVSVDKDHIEAQHLAEKLGFRKEGLMAEDICLEDGTYADRFIYGLTARMWNEHK